MKCFKTILAALLTLAIPAVCFATPPRPGPYVGGFVGVAIPNDADVNSNTTDLNDRIEFDPGVNAGGVGGFDFGFLRVEGELSYKHGEMKTVIDRAAGGVRISGVDGRIGALAMLGNVYIDLHNPGPITPYFGAGVGFAALHQDNTYSDVGRLYRDDDDAVFAWQAGGGFEIYLNRMLSLDIGYRYFATSTATFNADSLSENRLKFQSHNVQAGVRVKF